MKGFFGIALYFSVLTCYNNIKSNVKDRSMRIIHNHSQDPYFNLACEEYLLENSSDDIFMLWRNSAAVIIGKNQNAWSEVNTEFTAEKGIYVVRRLTGGGAVFHDTGNVNFTFITDADENTGIDFSRFISPILSALAGLGVTAEQDGRNDIVSEGFKVSGNAQCVYRRADGSRRLMHHGTLLYDADLTKLAAALRVNGEKLRSKGIRSVSSRVKNLRDIGGLELSPEEFTEYLKKFAEKEYGSSAEELDSREKDGIASLAKAKYSTWEWNFGKSPEHEASRSMRFPWGTAEISYALRQGKLSDISLRGDFFGTEDPSLLESALIGCRLDRSALAEAMAKLPIDKIVSGATVDDLLSLFFGDGE